MDMRGHARAFGAEQQHVVRRRSAPRAAAPRPSWSAARSGPRDCAANASQSAWRRDVDMRRHSPCRRAPARVSLHGKPIGSIRSTADAEAGGRCAGSCRHCRRCRAGNRAMRMACDTSRASGTRNDGKMLLAKRACRASIRPPSLRGDGRIGGAFARPVAFARVRANGIEVQGLKHGNCRDMCSSR